MLLVEYSVLDKVKVINEGTSENKKFKLRGKFQKCDEVNNNGRIYPRMVLENQVKSLQDKITERSLVGALDHPPNDAIHLSQASHVITKLWVEKNGDVMGECELLSTPNGKIVEALLNDNVKIGISSRGIGTLSEGKNGKVVNEDFKLITFDLVSDPSTKGAFPELTESVKINSEKAQKILTKYKKEKVLLTLLENKISKALGKNLNEEEYDRVRDYAAMKGSHGMSTGKYKGKRPESPHKVTKPGKAEGEPSKKPKGEDPHIGKKQKTLKFGEAKNLLVSVLKGIVNKTNKTKVIESLQRIEEGNGSKKDKDCIKDYLLRHLEDLFYARPIEASTSTKPVDYTKQRIDFLKRIIKVIEEI